MSTPFLVAFAEQVVERLERSGQLVIVPGGRSRVVLYVANWLGTAAQGGSLLSSLERALLDCPEVEELYADLDALKALVDDLGRVRVP